MWRVGSTRAAAATAAAPSTACWAFRQPSAPPAPASATSRAGKSRPCFSPLRCSERNGKATREEGRRLGNGCAGGRGGGKVSTLLCLATLAPGHTQTAGAVILAVALAVALTVALAVALAVILAVALAVVLAVARLAWLPWQPERVCLATGVEPPAFLALWAGETGASTAHHFCTLLCCDVETLQPSPSYSPPLMADSACARPARARAPSRPCWACGRRPAWPARRAATCTPGSTPASCAAGRARSGTGISAQGASVRSGHESRRLA